MHSGLCCFGDIPPRTAPSVLALTVSLNPRYLYASHPFLRSSGLTFSGHEPPKTSLILLNKGRTRPRDPLLAGKSRFLGVSSAGSLLVVCVPVNLDKSSCLLNWSVPPSAQYSDNRYSTSPPGCRRSLIPSHQLRRIKCQRCCASFFQDFCACLTKPGKHLICQCPSLMSDVKAGA
jgi:hypothetical protein